MMPGWSRHTSTGGLKKMAIKKYVPLKAWRQHADRGLPGGPPGRAVGKGTAVTPNSSKQIENQQKIIGALDVAEEADGG